MATLYSLNKDELVHLISTIEKTQKDKILTLEKRIAHFEKILNGHHYQIVSCSIEDCSSYESLIDGASETELKTCDMCENLYCRKHAKECNWCCMTYCSNHKFFGKRNDYCVRCTIKCKKCNVIYGKTEPHQC